VLSPELLVLDEPFEGLDPASRGDLVDLLNRLHRTHGVTLVMATHDVNLVPEMADVVYLLQRGGEIVAHGRPRDIFANVELLRRSNLEPPVLSELVARLSGHGLELGHPVTVEEAARAIAERCAVPGARPGAGPGATAARAGANAGTAAARGAGPEPAP
jgi:cobalt/nickel transport system ATP-binding protein